MKTQRCIVHCKKGCSHTARKLGPVQLDGMVPVHLDSLLHPQLVRAEDVEILDKESLS